MVDSAFLQIFRLYNDPGITSAKVVFVKGIDRKRLDALGLESSLKYFFSDDGCGLLCFSAVLLRMEFSR